MGKNCKSSILHIYQTQKKQLIFFLLVSVHCHLACYAITTHYHLCTVIVKFPTYITNALVFAARGRFSLESIESVFVWPITKNKYFVREKIGVILWLALHVWNMWKKDRQAKVTNRETHFWEVFIKIWMTVRNCKRSTPSAIDIRTHTHKHIQEHTWNLIRMWRLSYVKMCLKCDTICQRLLSMIKYLNFSISLAFAPICVGFCSTKNVSSSLENIRNFLGLVAR